MQNSVGRVHVQEGPQAEQFGNHDVGDSMTGGVRNEERNTRDHFEGDEETASREGLPSLFEGFRGGN